MVYIDKSKKGIDWKVGDTLISHEGGVYMICESEDGYFLINIESGKKVGALAYSLQELIDETIKDDDRKINLNCEIQEIY
jgi:hypothetical protein